jgi:glycosyltransferase involved in cell wall biosynthesis
MAELKENLSHMRHIRVAFVGSRAGEDVPAGFERVSPEDEADVYHVRHDRLAAVRDLRRGAAAAAVVVDLTGISAFALDRRALAIVHEADVVAVSSEKEATMLEQRDKRLAGRVSVMAPSIDLEHFAPDAVLAAKRRVHYSRFKRYHRLAPPTVLFAGEYVADGGLEAALEAVYILREELADIRLTAIPFGRVDQKHLDRCERRALILGHRGIVEWNPPAEDELPFWFASASVVLVAGDTAVRPAQLAAAAARPVVAVDAVRSPAAGPDALAAEIRALLGPAGTAEGERARQELLEGQELVSDRLAQLWSLAALGAGALSTDAFSAERAEATSAPSSSTMIQPL